MPTRENLYKATYMLDHDEEFIDKKFAGKKTIKINEIQCITHLTPNRLLSNYNELINPSLTRS